MENLRERFHEELILAVKLRDGLQRDDLRCAYCFRSLRDTAPMEVHIDHLRPVFYGGTNDPKNLVVACQTCNTARKAMPWRAFAVSRGYDDAIPRINRAVRRKVNYDLARAMLREQWAARKRAARAARKAVA